MNRHGSFGSTTRFCVNKQRRCSVEPRTRRREDVKGKFEKDWVCLCVITLTTTSSSCFQLSQSQDSSQRREPWPSSTSQPRARTSSRWRCVCHQSPCFLSCRNKFTHICHDSERYIDILSSTWCESSSRLRLWMFHSVIWQKSFLFPGLKSCFSKVKSFLDSPDCSTSHSIVTTSISKYSVNDVVIFGFVSQFVYNSASEEVLKHEGTDHVTEQPEDIVLYHRHSVRFWRMFMFNQFKAISSINVFKSAL